MPATMRLKTSDDVRRALAGIVRSIKNEDLDIARGRVLIYGLSTLGSIIKDSDLEARIQALEAAHEDA